MAFLTTAVKLLKAMKEGGCSNIKNPPIEAIYHNFLGFYRQILSRKTSQHENFKDVLNRFWLKSDIVICKAGAKDKGLFKYDLSLFLTIFNPHPSSHSL